MWELDAKLGFVIREGGVIVTQFPKELETQWRDLVAQANKLIDMADIIDTRKKQHELSL
jgi:hypothetical protein